ncbi:MAG: thiamine pyrophosphate-dependent enzyme [Vulcanimicrobiota bacterium]
MDVREGLVLPRLVEERMLLALRQGQLSKWFSGIGQEAIAVGATLALEPHDFILPLHRNLGVFTSRAVPLERIFAQILGRDGGFTWGRDRSFHFGAPEYHIVGMISHLGAQLGVADGIALAEKLDGSGRVVLAFSGEGGTSEGDFHEALNLAAVWDLPVIFLIENNGYALSTPIDQQFRCRHLVDKGIGYGIEAHQVDGNDVQAVYHLIKRLADERREQPRPALVEALTFRMRGHEEASGTAYVPEALLAHWAERDPLAVAGVDLDHTDLRQQIATAWEKALEAPLPGPGPEVLAPAPIYPEPVAAGPERRYIDALTEAHRIALEEHPGLVIMGQDVAEYGGVFKITEGLCHRFPGRVRNTPLCESAVVGAALGLAIRGRPSIVEMQFADFASCAFNQLINNLAKAHYRWGQTVPVVIRFPTGGGVGAGPFHSQSLEAFFTHVPGLKVVYPAFPHEAKGMLLAAVDDPNPVLFFEHKALYRRLKGPVPEGSYRCPLGQARVVKSGSQATIVTYGLGVHWALDLLARRPELQVGVVDLRSLVPLDFETVSKQCRHTGKVLVLHEDTLTGGFGAELAARIGEECFEYLDAPVMRCASLDTPVPFHKELEREFLAESRLEATLERLVAY